MRAIAITMLLLITISFFAAPASASTVVIRADKDQFETRIFLSLHQNMTSFANRTLSYDASGNQSTYAAFRHALEKIQPTASLSELKLDIVMNSTWLNITATMRVSGVTETRGDISFMNTAWRAFNVSADLRVANFSYNTVGRSYFRPVMDFYVNASRFEDHPNATIRAVNFFVNGTQSVAGNEAADVVGNFTVFDFRPLAVPLDEWVRTYYLSNHTTAWRYAPAPILAASVRASELNRTIFLFSDYSYSAEITVPGLARVVGNDVRVDMGTGQKEWLMLASVLLSIAFAIMVQLIFRSKKRSIRLGFGRR